MKRHDGFDSWNLKLNCFTLVAFLYEKIPEFLVKRRVQTQQNEKRGFDGPALSVRQTPESPLRASIYLIAGLGEFDQKGFFARIEVDFFDHADARGVELVLQ